MHVPVHDEHAPRAARSLRRARRHARVVVQTEAHGSGALRVMSWRSHESSAVCRLLPHQRLGHVHGGAARQPRRQSRVLVGVSVPAELHCSGGSGLHEGKVLPGVARLNLLARGFPRRQPLTSARVDARGGEAVEDGLQAAWPLRVRRLEERRRPPAAGLAVQEHALVKRNHHGQLRVAALQSGRLETHGVTVAQRPAQLAGLV
mmetsp:Transcript_47287/g.90257  ORF Transcript_47287/g.90257 Transcript_47287/m.90257 type:complete len:204 (+) Transcript_47287:1201-1812(+)